MGATRRELKRASAFGTKPVLAEAIELYHKRSIFSHFHLSVLIGARIGAGRLQADDCSTAGDGTQGYSHLRGIRPEAAALGEDVGCSAAAKLSNEEGHLVRRITPLRSFDDGLHQGSPRRFSPRVRVETVTNAAWHQRSGRTLY